MLITGVQYLQKNYNNHPKNLRKYFLVSLLVYMFTYKDINPPMMENISAEVELFKRDRMIKQKNEIDIRVVLNFKEYL